MYEFKQIIAENIVTVMASNWQTTCGMICPDLSAAPKFMEEKHILGVITKNIYHKRPPKLPITFIEVNISVYYVIIRAWVPWIYEI